jgi:type I restriction enzyme M protein
LLNSDTKRHIDAARDVLVGVAPNPTTQIDQITYALVYKFMDDMDQASIKAGGEPSFFVGDLEIYSWSHLMSTRMGNQEKIDLYSEALTKFSEAAQLPELFRTIFRAAFLPYRSPETLGMFLKEIAHFDYTHPEELGNAYEYLLSIMAAQGDAGQFRTPRHIIDFIVEIMNPSKTDKILDPACGTAGFLVSTYNHILQQHDGKSEAKNPEKPLSPDERRKLMLNLQGYDIDPTMVRIAQVNMYLHQFKNPQIFQYDSLTNDERWNEKFDIILANPPFMTPKGGIRPHSKFSISSKRSEVLFVDYIARHLKPNGRAAIIVPEGVVFKKGKAYQDLRKMLLQEGLYAVLSLPKGIFSPYSGFKTNILFLDKSISKNMDEILFINLRADGFDPGATKRPIDKNDLPLAKEILSDWANGIKKQTEISAYASRVELLDEYASALAASRYFKKDAKNATKWPTESLANAIVMNFGTRITKKTHSGTIFPVYGGGGESFRTNESNREDDYVISRFAMSENCVRFVSGQFWLLDSGGTFEISPQYKGKLLKEFVGRLLVHLQDEIYECSRGGGQRNLDNEQFGELEIPIPPREVQEQILSELQGYKDELVAAAQQVMLAEEKAKGFIDELWE